MSTYKDKYIKYKKKYIDLKYRMTGGTIICPKCTFENKSNAINCAICGAKLQKHENDQQIESALLVLEEKIKESPGSDKEYLIYLIKQFIEVNYKIKKEKIPLLILKDIENIVDEYKKNENNIEYLIFQIKTLIKNLQLIIANKSKENHIVEKKPKLFIHTLGLGDNGNLYFYKMWKEYIKPKILNKLLKHYNIYFIHYDETFNRYNIEENKEFKEENEEFKKENFDIKKFEELKLKSPNETHLIINMAGSHVNKIIPFMRKHLFLDIPYIPDFIKIKNFSDFKLIDYSIREKKVITVSEAMLKETKDYNNEHIKLILDDFEDKLRESTQNKINDILKGINDQKIRNEVFGKLEEKLKNLKHEIYYKIYIQWKNINITFDEINDEINKFVKEMNKIVNKSS